jgi:CDP-diacylglycerol--glycerol-3-phosphate 3-phosphatidyltransferase
MTSNTLFNPANILTSVRIILVPVFWYALQLNSPSGLVLALACVVLAEVTDLLDGWVARRFGYESAFGALFDPLADSLYRLGAFTALASTGFIPIWTVLIFAWRDTIVTYARMMMAQRGEELGARLSGKIKAIVQGAALIGIVAALSIPVLVTTVDPTNFIPWLYGAAVIVTAWSGVDYLIAGMRKFTAPSED